MIKRYYSNYQHKENQAALNFFESKLQTAPTNPRYNNFQAILHQAEGNNDQAEHYYNKTIEIKPHDVMARNDLALHIAQQGRYESAVDEFKKSLLIVDDQPTLHKNYAAVLARKGNFVPALEHANRAVQLNPFDAMSHRNLAKVREIMGDSRSALEHNLESIQLETHQRVSAPNTHAFRAAAVQLVVEGGDRAQAHALMDAARTFERKTFSLPSSSRTYEIIAKINSRRGDRTAELERERKAEEDSKVCVTVTSDLVPRTRLDKLRKL